MTDVINIHKRSIKIFTRKRLIFEICVIFSGSKFETAKRNFTFSNYVVNPNNITIFSTESVYFGSINGGNSHHGAMADTLVKNNILQNYRNTPSHEEILVMEFLLQNIHVI